MNDEKKVIKSKGFHGFIFIIHRTNSSFIVFFYPLPTGGKGLKNGNP
jgi:hypothetical protein